MQPRQGWLRVITSLGLMLGTCFIASVSLAQSPFGQQQEFLPPEQAFKPTLTLDDQALAIDWQIETGYYLYRHSLAAQAGSHELPLTLPEGETIEDEYFGRSEVYRHALRMTTQLDGADTVTLRWQGCADAGLCYPPQTQTFHLDDMATGAAVSDVSSETKASSGNTAKVGSSASRPHTDQADDQQLADQLASGDWGWALAAFFGMGLLLTFTPCVLPMIPILSSLIVGQRQREGHQRAAGFVLSLAYVLPMAVTYSLLGVAAAVAGANLQMLFQNVWFIGLFSALFVFLALAMFGAFELGLPSALHQRLDTWMSRQRGGRLKGVAVMGILSALLVGPCMTAPLAGALLFIAESGNPWLGGIALLALGLGMGTPLVLIGTIGGHFLPRPGAWMTRVKGLFGFVLLGMAIWFAARVMPDAIELGLWGALGLGFAISLRTLGRSHDTRGVSHQVATASAMIIGLWSALILVGAAAGGTNPWRPLAIYALNSGTAAVSEVASPQTLSFDEVSDLATLKRRVGSATDRNQLTLVEFTADWCISCEVIEQEVFGDASVQAELQDVQRLSVDVTDYDAEDQAIMQHFGIVGPPTLMWFGPDGQERRGARIIGELDAQDFLDRYAQVQQASDSAGGD